MNKDLVEVGRQWVYNFLHKEELIHYGIKGMKWGVRRTPKELRFYKGSIISTVSRNVKGTKTKNGILITGMSGHAGVRAEDRKVKKAGIIDAIKNPIHIDGITTDKAGRRSQRFIGISATVNVNPDTGVIVTVWNTGHEKLIKYGKGD